MSGSLRENIQIELENVNALFVVKRVTSPEIAETKEVTWQELQL
jgi:hypothetical protein